MLVLARAIYQFVLAIPCLAKLLIAIGNWQRDRDYVSVREDIAYIRSSLKESSMEYIALLEAAISLTSKVLNKMPDYPQKKKEQFFALKSRYDREKAKPIFDITKTAEENAMAQDDDELKNLREALANFVFAFEKEIA